MTPGPGSRLVLPLAAAMIFVSVLVVAQNPTPPAAALEPRRTVILNVRVTDGAGHAVVDVSQDSFTVTEDGVPQKLTLFSKAAVPLSYGLVIDNSASMRRLLDPVIQTAVKIVDSNQPEDETFLVRFISSDNIDTVVDFTSSKFLLQERLNDLYVEGGQTAVMDAVFCLHRSWQAASQTRTNGAWR